jgi:hypothetical protein
MICSEEFGCMVYVRISDNKPSWKVSLSTWPVHKTEPFMVLIDNKRYFIVLI